MPDRKPDPRHWRTNLRVTRLLLLLWFGVTFGVTFFARGLGSAPWGGSLSFWMAAQGTVIVYVLIVWAYARLMARYDDEFDTSGNG